MELLDFILSTTNLLYNGDIYRQIQGVPVGSPVLVAFYMEDHEQNSMESAPQEMKPKIS